MGKMKAGHDFPKSFGFSGSSSHNTSVKSYVKGNKMIHGHDRANPVRQPKEQTYFDPLQGESKGRK